MFLTPSLIPCIMYDCDNSNSVTKALEIFSLHQVRYQPSSAMDMSTSFNSVTNKDRDIHISGTGEGDSYRGNRYWVCKVWKVFKKIFLKIVFSDILNYYSLYTATLTSVTRPYYSSIPGVTVLHSKRWCYST